MRGAPFRAIGGAVVADHGPLSLRSARALAGFYRLEASRWEAETEVAAARACAARALRLGLAVAEAEAWRRAAGWRDVDAADG